MPRSRSSLVIVVALGLSTPGLVAGQEAPLRLVPIAPPIGCPTCDGPEAFGAVMGIAVGPDGAVAVADRDPPHIRRFEADGSIGTTFGRSGRGPGEFGTPSGIALMEGGEIVAADFRWTDVRVYSRAATS